MSGLFVDNQGPNWKKVWYHAKSTFAVLLSITVLVTIGWLGYKTVRDAVNDYRSTEDYISVDPEEVVFTVPRGASVSQIGLKLVNEDIIKSKKAWDKALRGLDENAKFEAGRFPLRKHMPAKDAVAVLSDPSKSIRVMATIPEGYTMAEQWPLIAKAVPQIKVADLQKAAKNTKALGLPAWAKAPNNPEGFFFPETYEVDDSPTATELLKAQVAQFNKVTTELNFEDRAKSRKLTPMQVLVMASLIEREAKGDDMAMVAQVFYNRLDKKMKFQSDATVIYANGIKGRLTTTDKERALKSPYNTYHAEGLPPGPISNPGKEAMNAALNPKKHDFLYFVVTDPSTGKTEYAKTFDEHKKNVAKFLAWCDAHPGKCE